MTKAKFYHAGCPVCSAAETSLLSALDRDRIDVEIVHLGESPDRVPEAAALGVQSVPALVLDQEVLHVNFGASIRDLEGGHS